MKDEKGDCGALLVSSDKEVNWGWVRRRVSA
jgi:hypothetical protein